MNPDEPEEWKAEIQSHREQKIETFQSQTDSPLSESARNSFSEIDFFPIDASFRLGGRLELFAEPTNATLEATQGPPISFEQVGQVGVELAGELSVLSVYRAPGVDALLLPFRDPTNGSSTWAHGRYLNIPAPDPKATDKSTPVDTVVDFNVAYHPLCVYDDTVRSAKAPTDNEFDVPIQAGERL
ncbi:MAG: DUF1684 domain-containing protein [Halodesulfurarchaeum sp.]|nr:DUF1684 domain-containing protein [Halodesulfurarchaeum sp.]